MREREREREIERAIERDKEGERGRERERERYIYIYRSLLEQSQYFYLTTKHNTFQYCTGLVFLYKSIIVHVT